MAGLSMYGVGGEHPQRAAGLGLQEGGEGRLEQAQALHLMKA